MFCCSWTLRESYWCICSFSSERSQVTELFVNVGRKTTSRARLTASEYTELRYEDTPSTQREPTQYKDHLSEDYMFLKLSEPFSNFQST